MRLIIPGAGLAGLSRTEALKEYGIEAAVFDASDGRLRTLSAEPEGPG